MKLLVLWPAGEVYNETSVRAFEWADREALIRCNLNRGDMFVHEASLKLINFTTVENLPTDDPTQVNDELMEWVNTFDYCLVRGSNYVYRDTKFARWIDFFKKIEIPLLIFGMGAQAKTVRDEIFFTDEDKYTFSLIAEKARVIGVRGQYTADILNGIGIKNVEPIGCPSLFRNNNPKNQIVGNYSEAEKIGLTVHPTLGGIYAANLNATTEFQKAMIGGMFQRKDAVSVMTQGDPYETRLCYEPHDTDARKRLLDSGIIPSEFQERFFSSLFTGGSAAEYYDFSSGLDFVTGVRLHGNTTALASGRPSVFWLYDSRTEELADQFSIPAFNVEDVTDWNSIHSKLLSADFHEFNRNFSKNYHGIRSFLEKNEVPHKMGYF